MKTTKSMVLAGIFGVAALLSANVFAQPAGSAAPSEAPKNAPSEVIDGEVRKVDKATGKITLKHGEIKSLGLPATTMAFQAADKVLLEKIKAGDKVKFIAANDNGKPVLLDIQAVN